MASVLRARREKGKFLASLPSLTLRFQPRSTPSVWLLALTWIRKKYGLFCSLLHNNDFFNLHSTPQAVYIFFSRPWKVYLSFIIPLFPRLLLQQHLSSSRKFSLFLTIIPLQSPLSLNFAIHTFLVFIHGRQNTILCNFYERVIFKVF